MLECESQACTRWGGGDDIILVLKLLMEDMSNKDTILLIMLRVLRQ